MKLPIILFVLLLYVPAFSQMNNKPICISMFNESTAIPFTRLITTPFHPGIQIGTEFDYRVKNHSRLFQTANLNYFYHKYLAHGFGIQTEIGIEYHLLPRLSLGGLLGIGYMRTFSTANEYVFSNGQYHEKKDKGNSRITPSISVQASYNLQKSEPKSPKIFIRYQGWAEYPYSPDFIPVMTHINFHLGVQLFIKNSKNENE